MANPGNAVADKYVAQLLMLSFFIPMHLQVVVLFAGCGWFVMQGIIHKERTPVYNYISAIALGATYLLYLGALLFTPAQYGAEAGILSEHRASFLALPIVFAAISPARLKALTAELLYFVYFTVITCLAVDVWFLIQFGTSPTGFKGVNHVTYRIFFEQETAIHPTYMSMYIVFAICILLLHGQQLSRMVRYGLFYLLLLLLLLLLAKSPILGLGIILAHTAWLRRDRLAQYKWVFIGGVLLVALSYLFIPFVSQRVNEMAGMSTNLRQNVTDNSIHERKMILATDLDMLRHYWLTGCGPGRLRHLLRIRYLFYSLYYGRDVGAFDPHNEYLYQWISFGIVGIVLFLSGLTLHFITAIRRRQYLYTYLLITLYITFFTESVLATQRGVIFFAFFTSLLFFCKERRFRSV